jgi:hypothetical protein
MKLNDNRGVVVVIVAMSLVTFIGLAAIVIDIGQIIVVKGELQNGADAGALSGVVNLIHSGSEAAEVAAVAYSTQSKNYMVTKPAPAADAVDVTVLAPEKLQVEVSRKDGTTAGPVPTIFARVFGIQDTRVEALAVATVDHKVIGTGPGHLLPFGLHKRMVDADDDGVYDVGSTIDVYPRTWTPGNFGVLDLDGGSNSNDDTVDWIEYSFDQSFVIPQSTGFINIPGDTGISGDSLSGPVRSRIGERVLFPVFDKVTGEGSGSTFRVIDLVGIIVRDANLIGDLHKRHFSITITKFSSTSFILGDGSAPSNASLSKAILIR